MGQLINLDEVDLQQAPLPSKAVDDDDWFDSFTPTGAHQGEQDLIVLCDDLLELDTPPSTTPKHGKALSLPSSPLLSPEQALRLFEPPQYHYSPTLASVIDIKDVPLETPLVDIDDHQESSPPRRNPPATPPVPRAPLNSPSQSSSHPSSQSTQASSHCVLSVPTQPAARAPQFVPAFEPSAQSRPLEGRPAQHPLTPRPPLAFASPSSQFSRQASFKNGRAGPSRTDRPDHPTNGPSASSPTADLGTISSNQNSVYQSRPPSAVPRAAAPHLAVPAVVPPSTSPEASKGQPTRLFNRHSDSDSELTEPESGNTYFYAPSPDEMAELSQDALADKAAYELYLLSPSPRLSLPADIGTKLEESLLRSWAGSEPSAGRVRLIRDLLATLTAGLNRWEPQRDLRVDPFGSVAWGGSTGSNGDLDLVIIDKRLPEGYHPSLWRTDPVGDKYAAMRSRTKSKRSLYNVYYLKQRLSEIGGVSDCQTVRGATVPIVKFKYRNNIECDINVNDMGGWNNSKLILAYCELSPYVLRPLIHFLKLWAARFNLNDPSASRGPRTFSSYCLTLMAIAYLQKVGHLPNLQEGVEVPQRLDPSDVDMPDTVWVNWGRDKGAAAHIWFRQKPRPGWVQEDISLGDALVGFFAFLKNAFDPNTHILSVLNGGVINRSLDKGTAEERRRIFRKEVERLSPEHAKARLIHYDAKERTNWHEGMGTGASIVQPFAWTRESLVVQDPFIWEKNCAGGISPSSVTTFFNTVDITYRKLLRGRHHGITELLR